MPIIEQEFHVAAPAERVFDLSRSVEVHVASTSSSEEKAVGGVTSGLLGLGDEVTWSARHLFVRQELTSRITAFERPHHFRDSMVHGAFVRFDHDHFFMEAADGCLVRDRFDFDSPFGPLGELVNSAFLIRYMERFLSDRNLVVKAIAESTDWKRYLQRGDPRGVVTQRIELIRKVEEHLRDWNPIGLGVPPDEYASYAPRIASLVEGSCSIESLALHLERLRAGMTLEKDAEKDLRTASAILQRAPGDEDFMRLAIREGRRALPACLPNPPVGCAMVRKGEVVSTGFTQAPGEWHAEAMALNSLEGDLGDVVAYVTLEPCSFEGRTPSCAESLIDRGIKRVVVGVVDPDPRNSGAGIETLRSAGVVVELGVLETNVLKDLVEHLHPGESR